ncbi:MAG: NADH-ubiquinone oxidoreductase-F iron-sulfur binding region domain-containing protein [Gammaproteobacteria bacterium]|nr:NADH-ubiquinone oxidoreductase-F iron-sulfur binding region domain-containing protein [Gammaproteobacteria bacterium]
MSPTGAHPDESRPLTGRIDAAGGPVSLEQVKTWSGYAGARRAWLEMSREEVIEEVKAANLRGRGGAGFAAGVKWGFVPSGEKDDGGVRYLIANCDEMEPGTFKDRYLLENDPHLLIEGMVIGARAIRAEHGFIFLRGEYVHAAERLRQALGEAEAEGWIGDDACGSGEPFHLHLHLSGGRYICGEETALLNALEGRMPQPRARPPFPPASGAWGRPTIVNNCETLCNVPAILRCGAEAYTELGIGSNSGTKLYGVSGRVRRPGLKELPLGTSIREILFEHAGGMLEGHHFRGLLPGGASTDFLVEEHLDLPMDFESIGEAGSRMGTGTMVVVDDSVCIVDLSRNLQHFFAQESCGFCTPCREGLPVLERMLMALEEGTARPGDLERMERQAGFIGVPGNTFCVHATGAMEPLRSALKHFREDFEAHLEAGGCPHRARVGAAAGRAS